MNYLDIIFYVIVLIMSVVVHEVAHGFAAFFQGDNTAKDAGRLTLNPLRHIDPIGSVILPALLVIMHAGFILGWAKPVPYVENNLRNKKWGTIVVASAGIIANLGLALLFGIAIRFAGIFGSGADAFVSIAVKITIVNLLLALFNLIPIPPLDGSKIFFSLLPDRLYSMRSMVERFSLPLLLVFIIFIWPLISPAIGYIFGLITGLAISFA